VFDHEDVCGGALRHRRHERAERVVLLAELHRRHHQQVGGVLLAAERALLIDVFGNRRFD